MLFFKAGTCTKKGVSHLEYSFSSSTYCAVFENVYCYSTKSCVTDLFPFLDPVAHGPEVRGAGSQVLSDTVPRVHKSDLLY